MDRREFLKTTSAAAAASAAASGTALAATEASASLAKPALGSGVKLLRLAMAWPDSTGGLADQAHRLARRIETAMSGRYRIDVQGAGHDDADAVAEPRADLHFGTRMGSSDDHPAHAFFTGLPGLNGMRARDLEAWIIAGGGQMLWDDLSALSGVKPLLAGHSGRRSGLWSREPIISLTGLEDRKIYADGPARDVARGLGADPVHVPVGKLAKALAAGEIAAVEWGGALASLAIGLPAVASHYVESGLTPRGHALALWISRTIWDKLDAADQAIFEACAAAEFSTSLAEARAHEQILRDVFKARGVMVTPRLPASIRDARDRVAAAVVAHIAGTDAYAGRINASYMAFRRNLSVPRSDFVA